MQSKWKSFLETVTNTTVSFVQGFLTQLFAFPFFGLHVTYAQNASLVTIFLIVSFVRTYIIRRIFNRSTDT